MTDTKLFRWLTLIWLVGMTALFLLLGWTAMQYGGIPHGYHRYGIVAVPGRQIIDLPAGRVMLDHADDVEACWDNTTHVKNATIYSAPEGLAARIVPLDGNTPLTVTRVPHWLYTSQVNCRGHEPWGRIDVPDAGRYLVETTDNEHGGFSGPPQPHGPTTHTSTKGTGIAFGSKPWAPFGSPLLAGIAVSVLTLAAAAILAAVGFLIWGEGPLRTRLQQLGHPLQLLSRTARALGPRSD